MFILFVIYACHANGTNVAVILNVAEMRLISWCGTVVHGMLCLYSKQLVSLEDNMEGKEQKHDFWIDA